MTTADAGSPYPFFAAHLYCTVSLGVLGRFILYRLSTGVEDNTVESPTLVHSMDRGGVPVVVQIRVTVPPSWTGTVSKGRLTVGGSKCRKHVSRKHNQYNYSHSVNNEIF